MHTLPSNTFTVNLIGAGRLATQFAVALAPHATIQAIYARQLERAQALHMQTHALLVTDDLSCLPRADLTILAVSDGSIAAVADALVDVSATWPHACFIHCSGAQPSTLLMPLKQQGHAIASVHPFRPFTHTPSDRPLANCYCFVEGDALAIEGFTPLFQAAGAILLPIEPDQKTIAHLSSVLASNHLVTLASLAQTLLTPIVACEETRAHVVTDLLTTTLQNLKQHSHFPDAFTGPLTRGDAGTIQAHLNALEHPNQKRLYQTLSIIALQWMRLDEAKRNNIMALLEE